MTRAGYFLIHDKNTITALKVDMPELTDEDATKILRAKWLAHIYACYHEETQPMFGGGFTPEDDLWLDDIIAAIKNKSPSRPQHRDQQTEFILSQLKI